jgi:hypothetical protein
MKKKTMHNAMDFTMFAACCLAMLYVWWNFWTPPPILSHIVSCYMVTLSGNAIPSQLLNWNFFFKKNYFDTTFGWLQSINFHFIAVGLVSIRAHPIWLSLSHPILTQPVWNQPFQCGSNARRYRLVPAI